MNDADVIDEFVREATPTIEDLVTTALREGRQPEHVAIILERGIDGAVRGHCGLRRDIATKLGLDARLSVEQRGAVVTAMSAAGGAVPTIILLAGEGHVIVGVRTLGGSLVAIS